MAVDYQIINRALYKLGQEPIDQAVDSLRKTIMEGIFDDVKEEMLSKHVWSFAMVKETLLSTGSMAGDSTFALPMKYLAFVSINGDPSFDFNIRGLTLYTSGLSIDLEYISNVETSLFSSLAKKCFLLELALEACTTLTGDSKLKESLRLDLEMAQDNARSIDSLNHLNEIDGLDYLEDH